MSDDLQTNLSTYKLQLQQVEASLTTDPDNEDLLKLKNDLQEVIDLTVDLIGTKLPPTATEILKSDTPDVSTHTWKSGDPCMAIWSEDGQYYGSKIDEILEDGTCTVTFDSWGNTEVTNVTVLKPIDPNALPGSSDDKHKSKRDKIAEQREYKKKKTQKKAQRLKAQEEERETEKNKWLDFNAKTFSKTNKGKVKKSIFATPDHVNGKVGVGTCGQSGKPMTKYTHQEKWKK
ncbi:survival of motor neuron-related-splicing factor 30-like [Mytilus californianus]|uniref:survival of motor neuron-related-splicing factor 30-like n=1 Tax=Mytilus californianus TaxID=6549 RepID=UPI002246A557|nr:survival of motor neuron-related-splicing factor 30-like [Mytilus californianus]